MKKIFTFFAASLLALGASAQDESGVIEGCGWKATGVAPEAGATLIDDFYVTAKTVYATTVTADEFNTHTGSYIYGPGNNFTHRMNVRVDAWPNPDNLTGTEKERLDSCHTGGKRLYTHNVLFSSPVWRWLCSR